MQYFPIFLLLLTGLFLLSRTLTTFIHELGHAIPAIILTKQKTTIYIGTYGDPKKSLKLQIGLLEIFIRYNPFKWKLGLCVPSAESISFNNQIIYIISGPIASLLIATITFYFTFLYDLHGFLKLFLSVFMASSIFDLFANLIPTNKPIQLHDGTITYNDGFLIKQLLSYKQFSEVYIKAVNLYNHQKFSEAAVIFENLLKNLNHEDIFRYAISSYLQIQNFLKAKELLDQFKQSDKFNSDDFANIGFTYSRLGLYIEALNYYNQSLILNPLNILSQLNKGFTLILLNKYQEAINIFENTLENEIDSSFSYCNRGLALIKIGKIELGLRDINRSLDINPDNSYSFRNLGIYHFDNCEYEEALRLFTKAKELDDSTYEIEDLIIEAKSKLM